MKIIFLFALEAKALPSGSVPSACFNKSSIPVFFLSLFHLLLAFLIERRAVKFSHKRGHVMRKHAYVNKREDKTAHPLSPFTAMTNRVYS